MDSLNNSYGEVFSYADALGKVEPEPVENFEAGKVELSIPMKYIPQAKKTKIKPEPKNPPLPKGVAVPVFSHETYVDEEGIEHMVPPTYDKSKMNLPKAKFQKPADMPESMDISDVAEDAETPRFLQNWQDETENDAIDNQLNSLLDDDIPLDFVQTTDDEDKMSARALSAENNLGGGQSESVENKASFQGQNVVSPRGQGAFSSASLLQEFAKKQDVIQENDDVDLENLDAIIAAHSPVQEEIKVEELGNDEVMSGDAQNRENVEERAAIPSFDNVGNDDKLEVKVENTTLEEAKFEVEQKPEQENIVIPEVETIEPQIVVDNEGSSFVAVKEDIVGEEPAALSAELVDDVNVSEIKTADVTQGFWGENKFAQEYSLGLAENYRVISALDMPQSFKGDDKVNAIQINVGESDYGWSVVFDNGIVMGISDVRRYQLQFGALPSANGIIAYGKQKMGFNNIKKIVLYQTPKYFRYTL